MSDLVRWQFTDLPNEIIDIVEKDIQQFDNSLEDSSLIKGGKDEYWRKSKNTWVPSGHWIGGWIWYYVNKINRENFRYDIVDIDDGHMQYTHYAPGEYYNWHPDSDLDLCYTPKVVPGIGANSSEDNVILQGEYTRKLSFTLQLTDPKDYTGGELEFIDNSNQRFMAPKTRGTLVVFDSRVRHRVRKVRSGLRKSIVGWVVGPRWK